MFLFLIFHMGSSEKSLKSSDKLKMWFCALEVPSHGSKVSQETYLHNCTMQKNIGFKDRAKSVLLWFHRNNSIGGLACSCNADNQKSKAYWFVLFVIGSGLTTMGVWTTVAQYLEFNSLTRISYKFQSKLTMPAVTVCNSNRVHCYNLYETIRNISSQVISLFLFSLLFLQQQWNSGNEKNTHCTPSLAG